MSANLANADSYYAEINDACERFEAEWRSGRQPQIEVYVAEVAEGARSELVRELLKLDIYYRRERGDTILPSDYESYPQHATLIDELLGPCMHPAEAIVGDGGWWRGALTREPEPTEAATLVNVLEALLHGLPVLFRDVLERRLQDQPVAEIAKQLGVSRQAVSRVLGVLKERLEKSLDAGKC